MSKLTILAALFCVASASASEADDASAMIQNNLVLSPEGHGEGLSDTRTRLLAPMPAPRHLKKDDPAGPADFVADEYSEPEPLLKRKTNRQAMKVEGERPDDIAEDVPEEYSPMSWNKIKTAASKFVKQNVNMPTVPKAFKDRWEKRAAGYDFRQAVPKYSVYRGYYIERGHDLTGFDLNIALSDMHESGNKEPMQWMSLDAAKFKCSQSELCEGFLTQGDPVVSGESCYVWFKASSNIEEDGVREAESSSEYKWNSYLKKPVADIEPTATE